MDLSAIELLLALNFHCDHLVFVDSKQRGCRAHDESGTGRDH